jgi:hypothetical protein
LVTEKEKELIQRLRSKTTTYWRMHNFLFNDLGLKYNRFFDLSGYSDEFIMEAINFDYGMRHKLFDKKLYSIKKIYSTIDTLIPPLRDQYKLAKFRLIKIRNELKEYQERFPEIRSPLANISPQFPQKIEFEDEELVY